MKIDNHPVVWAAPQPLWKEATNRQDRTRAPMGAPAILRFTKDEFMEEFRDVLATDPQRLGEYRVVRETWRGVFTTQTPLAPKTLFALPFARWAEARKRLEGRAPAGQGRKPQTLTVAAPLPLKLYQPAHQRFYLVTSTLVCQTAGLPDRKVDPGRQEQAGFLVRRLLKPQNGSDDPQSWPEHAWVEENGARRWRVIDSAGTGQLVPGEEVLPLFGINHAQDDQRQRRMFAGLVPVGKREAYLAAAGGPSGSNGGITAITARKALLRKEVIEPWKALIARAETVAGTLGDKSDSESLWNKKPTAANDLLKSEREQLQLVSWLILLDFARFLQRYIPNVWDHIQSASSTTPLSSAETKLLDAIDHVSIDGTPATGLKSELEAANGTDTVKATLTEALRLALDSESKIEGAETPFKFGVSTSSWPHFLFPLADPLYPAEAALPRSTIDPLSDPEIEDLSDEETAGSAQAELDLFAAAVVRALPQQTTEPQPAPPLAARKPADALEGWFVIRCVYARPACGKLHDDVLSAPTEPFQMAGFFDPDAPARPIRIGLPIDTTPAGLRKFDRNTAFVISDTLCGQLARMKGLTLGDLVRTVLPWPLQKDLDVPDTGSCQKNNAGFGMICTLSIPIITICALILLMIVVNLLNIIFKWIPFFIMCFPLPGIKGKPAQP